ncbi:MAG: AI-2E family transporter [Lachnospiraceae bacterium]|nr:AI-2E family transporter [Lachnospiraceae bacterium]MDD7378003.1 AI-2E family transporter [Lachnospiraceae bacterium]MDY4616985.1 AI-2E family transporter [Lachnospiraceae bacterium]
MQEKKQSHWNIRPYLAIALTAVLVICLCIVFFFLIYRYNGFAAGWKKLTAILQPIIIGIVIAYLINPIMVFFEKHLMRWIEPKMKKKVKAKKLCRGIATLGALAVFILIIVVLLVMLVPQLVESIQGVATTLPSEVQHLIDKTNKYLSSDSEAANFVEDTLIYATNYIKDWAMNDLLPKSNTYLTSITTGLINVFKVLLNIIVGLIVSVYLLFSKETFIGQFKKLNYALFKPKKANIVIQTARKSNEIFGGFISGKILDSMIIGIICYIVLLIMKMPYPVLVSVIVGVTNIIPFFGPFIGAVPSFIIIVLANPIQGLYFLIFVVILQQVDGNIIGPNILGDSTGLSPFWVIFAIMVGGGLFGFAGMLLGVPTFAVIYYIMQEILRYFLRKRDLPQDSSQYIELEKINVATNQPQYFQKEKETNEKDEEKA